MERFHISLLTRFSDCSRPWSHELRWSLFFIKYIVVHEFGQSLARWGSLHDSIAMQSFYADSIHFRSFSMVERIEFKFLLAVSRRQLDRVLYVFGTSRIRFLVLELECQSTVMPLIGRWFFLFVFFSPEIVITSVPTGTWALRWTVRNQKWKWECNDPQSRFGSSDERLEIAIPARRVDGRVGRIRSDLVGFGRQVGCPSRTPARSSRCSVLETRTMQLTVNKSQERVLRRRRPIKPRRWELCPPYWSVRVSGSGHSGAAAVVYFLCVAITWLRPSI